MSSYLKDKKVLVTGGAGFIGSHVVDRLLNLGAKVIVLDNLITGKLENIESNLNRLKFIQKDLTDDKALEKALEGVEFISHQAALRSVPKSMEEPLEYHQINASGTLNLFKKAKEKGVKRIVFASSSSVYGERVNFPEREDERLEPISPYAVTKLIGEYYGNIFSKSYNLEVVSLRYFNVFGPRQSLENEYAVVIPKFITCFINNEKPPVYGDGNQERDFIYIDNVVEANIQALTKENISGEVFNIASSSPQSVNDLIDNLREIFSKDIEANYLEARPGDVRKTYADITKAKKLLDWQPKIDFYSGLKITANWFKNR
ncbi:MAG: SDR family oxidoreductase [Candidatus Omnitrophica bacterium]|nr:SDR family oxidoreductase [Candidatus Omnitrophota bacterium]